jgi:hypothetical protein
MQPRSRSLAPLGVAATVALLAATVLPDATSATAASASTRLVGPLVTESSDLYGTPFSAPSVAPAGTPLPANRSASLTEALRKATSWNIPGPGTIGPVFPSSRPDLCLTAGQLDGDAVLQPCTASTAQQFAQAPNTGSNNPAGTGLRSETNGGFLGILNDDGTMRLQSQRTADRIASLDRFVPALSAAVRSTDVLGHSAVLEGFANAGSDIVIAGAAPARADASGAWTATVTGLQLGANTVRVEQVEAGQTTGSVDLDVTLEYSSLTAGTTFPDDRDQDVIVSGTAEPGATVEVLDTAGLLVASVGADAATGTWSTPVTAPDRGGAYRLRAVQRIGNATVDDVPLVIDYGAAVSVRNPVDGSDQDTGPLEMTGAGDPTGFVTVREGDEVMGSAQVNSSGTWQLTTGDLDARRHELVATQVAKGNNTTTAAVTINPDGGSVPAPTAEVDFDTDVSKRATVSGTGADGATIDLFVGTEQVGTTKVTGGTWSTTINPVGAGAQTIRVRQTLDDDTQAIQVVADYGRAVEFLTADGVRFDDGQLTVSGRSSTGATVTITTGGRQVDQFTVDSSEGTFTRTLQDVGSGPIDLTMTASSRGGLSTSDHLRAVSAAEVEALTLASQVRGGTFDPGPQVFAGRGTAGATVRMNPFGFEDRYSAYDLTTRVDQFGEWSIARGLANTPYPRISFAQTPQAGVVNQLLDYDLKPYREIGTPEDVTLTTFSNGDFFTPGNQDFAGRATPGATVTLNPFGFEPRFAAFNLTTTASLDTGTWQIRRSLGNSVYREVAVRQDPADPGTVNSIEHITIAPVGWVGQPADLTLQRPGPTFVPGVQTFSGIATPGTKVTLYPFGDDRYADINMTTTANAVGTWTIIRRLGNQVFPVVVTQTPQNGKVNRVAATLSPAPR